MLTNINLLEAAAGYSGRLIPRHNDSDFDILSRRRT